MKANEYGRFIRSIRKERGDTLNTMAQKLGVSIAFLSALEVGKKTIPLIYVDKIAEAYGFDENQKTTLANVIDLSNERILIQLEELDNEKTEVALAFARNVSSLSQDQIDKIKAVLA